MQIFSIRKRVMAAIATQLSLPSGESTGVPIELIWRLSVEQYHAMIQMGILTEDDPVELLEGWLVTKMPKNPKHSAVTRFIRDALTRIAPSGWYVDSQEPLTTSDSEPEPDVMIMQGEARRYLDRHPIPQEVALVVEVADSSLQRDRMLKKRLYAAAGIPVYWVVNLPELRIEVYSDPSGPGEQPAYRHQQDYGTSDIIPIVLGGVEVACIAVRELLP
jgi:Uma2 family endonuclease